jgi:translation initiation factor IF-2
MPQRCELSRAPAREPEGGAGPGAGGGGRPGSRSGARRIARRRPWERRLLVGGERRAADGPADAGVGGGGTGVEMAGGASADSGEDRGEPPGGLKRTAAAAAAPGPRRQRLAVAL